MQRTLIVAMWIIALILSAVAGVLIVDDLKAGRYLWAAFATLMVFVLAGSSWSLRSVWLDLRKESK